jgi:hypothetical protein
VNRFSACLTAKRYSHNRLAAEDAFGHRGHAFDDPPLAEKIIGNENTTRLKGLSDIGQGLFGEQVTFQPDIGVAAVEND